MTGTWTLIDSRGHACRQGTTTPWFEVSLDGLPEGMYVLRTTEPDGTTRAVRVVKQP
jgi:hypothetical protein